MKFKTNVLGQIELYQVTDDGLKTVWCTNEKDADYLLEHSGEAYFVDQIDAIGFAIQSISAQIKEILAKLEKSPR